MCVRVCVFLAYTSVSILCTRTVGFSGAAVFASIGGFLFGWIASTFLLYCVHAGTVGGARGLLKRLTNENKQIRHDCFLLVIARGRTGPEKASQPTLHLYMRSIGRRNNQPFLRCREWFRRRCHASVARRDLVVKATAVYLAMTENVAWRSSTRPVCWSGVTPEAWEGKRATLLVRWSWRAVAQRALV